jgi:hypothetical protein
VQRDFMLHQIRYSRVNLKPCFVALLFDVEALWQPQDTVFPDRKSFVLITLVFPHSQAQSHFV